MSNISKAFQNGKALIPFLTCGDPDLETTASIVRTMADSGADLIELGVPFSDPTAESPVAQEASIRALRGGVTTDKVFALVRQLRKDVSVPMVLMTYANVVFSYGSERFLSTCGEIGIDGLLLPDVPYEEKEEFLPLCQKYGLDLISTVAHTSGQRAPRIAREASGFLYVMSSPGDAGAQGELQDEIGSIVRLIHGETGVPCAVDSGISTPEQAKMIAGLSDGVIVDSAIVQLIAEYGRDAAPYVARFVRQMKDAITE